ncbi:radical SAM family heme chaperone HemW [Gallaecimonas xiamenensis]|uniref:Heme chaperone HemW n=1 Tax=Gallaecimonas xiamenensis 3-C-1 TaxID=745411 RepID=K2KEJ1_9GAMM|nr:radical SAM family heme chaperone HemW [Gallaecimonas xiamenensis]EKE75705.1 oxygen-independent coproporphyrinogen III oxidase [Gallaecimonas xiamenensis 3-C-1]
MLPLSLYIHIPWCVQKCPYCDFNSHAIKDGIPETQYVDALLADLEADLPLAGGRQLQSIFIGGGTPSVFSTQAIARLLAGVRERIAFADDIEITLEANPGTVEADKFEGFAKGGVNRLSIGVQSLQQDKLNLLGRIHGPEEALRAAALAADCGVRSFNLDLMHGLPNQRPQDALDDLKQAIACNPAHLSWYQLTIEPNTLFASKPPVLPDDDTLWHIQEEGHQLLLAAGYRQYEISAYAKPGFEARHNLNYWRFGDYLGIGCGAHGKLTQADGRILRTVKVRHPKGYLDPARSFMDQLTEVDRDDLPFEYFMNRLRLFEAVPKAEFMTRTGLPLEDAEQLLADAKAKGMVRDDDSHWLVTEQGHRYLNQLLASFL